MPSQCHSPSDLALDVSGLAAAAPSTTKAAEAPKGNAGRRLLAGTYTGISPTYGPLEGNSLVMIVGSSIPASTIKLECKWAGSTLTTATRINDTHVSCRTPKMSTGAKSLKIREGGTADRDISANPQFTFFPTMYVSDFKTSSVLRYNADTGAFFDVFVQPRSGGLDGPWGLAFGLDHNMYVASERTNR